MCNLINRHTHTHSIYSSSVSKYLLLLLQTVLLFIIVFKERSTTIIHFLLYIIGVLIMLINSFWVFFRGKKKGWGRVDLASSGEVLNNTVRGEYK